MRNAAFADHWGSAPVDEASWHSLVRGHGARADLSVVAVEEATGEVVGLCLNQAYPEDDELTGRQEAWIENLATAGRWRGRGVASSMIAWSMRAFAEAGFSHAMIAVDTDNLTGAARLYRSVGFERERRSVTHQIELASLIGISRSVRRWPGRPEVPPRRACWRRGRGCGRCRGATA